MTTPAIRFSAIGLNHNHIYGQTNLLLRAGAELVSFYAPEPELAAQYSQTYPQARLARSKQEILADKTIQLVIGAGIPCDRAPLGIEVMQHGKDYMSDKPGFTSLDQLAEVRQVQAETGRIYSICFSERLEVASAVRAGELVKAGAIGRVVQTVGLGPHRIHPPERPDWFYQKARYGGILAVRRLVGHGLGRGSLQQGRPVAVHAPYPPSSTRTSANPAHRRVHQAREACAPPELSYTTTILSLPIPQARTLDCSSPISGKGRLPDVGVGFPQKSVAK